MKKTTIGIVLLTLLAAGTLRAQESDITLSDKEIMKKGWNFGPLPVVGFDSDLGFQYGASCDIFNYGDGSRYPAYDYKMNVQASAYTKGSYVFRANGEIKSLIPDGKLFVDACYLGAQKFEFFGFDGFAAYDPASNPVYTSTGTGTPLSDQSAFNWMERNQLRFLVSMQKKIAGHLNWTAGVAYYHTAARRIGLEAYADQTTLYELYRSSGLIGSTEADGGNVTHFKVGLTYDTRNHDSDPTRGVNIEGTLVAAPDIIDRDGFSNLGFTFSGAYYLPVWGERITFAQRLVAQAKLCGEVPWYFTNNINSMFFTKLYTEGMGGNASVRGIHRNGVLADSYAWLNTEFRVRIVDFRFINQNWTVALNPFTDWGKILTPYRLDEMEAAGLANYAVDDLKKAATALHGTAGCGFKLIMNHNMVVSFEAAKALDERDGSGLWTNIGFNYLF